MTIQSSAGTCYLKVNGTQYALRGKFTYQPLDKIRSGYRGQDEHGGFTEKPENPYVEMDLTDLGGVSVKSLQALEGATLTAELRNGKTIVLHEAFYAGEAKVGTEEGSFSGRFEGLGTMDELLAQS